MNEREIRIGILGGGRWTQSVHLPNLRRVPGARVVAVSSNSLERRQACRSAWGSGLCFYEEPEDLLEDELDAVLICTPNHTHEALSLRALERGRHVLCEKPAAFTAEGVDRIAAARNRAGTVFQVDLELRYSAAVQRMERLIRSGEVGAVTMLHCFLLRNWAGTRGWRSEPERSGGIFLELGIHYLDLFNLLADSTPHRVFSVGQSPASGHLPESVCCSLEYASGAVASLGVTLLGQARKEIALHVVGTEARLEAELLAGRVLLWRRGAPEPEDHSPAQPPEDSFSGFPGSLEAVADWIECIRSGAAPRADVAVARAATEISAAAERSLAGGGPVPV